MSYLFFYLDTQNLNDESNRLKLDFNDANLGSITVQELKDKLSLTRDDLPKSYDLTFFGRLLSKKDNQLSAYGIRSGACLFVLSNQILQDQPIKEKKPKIDQAELQKMMVPIRTALVNQNFRSMLNRLYDKEFRENIVACTPELRNNIVAFSILQDPELMIICTDKENLPKISEKYSVFAEVAIQLAVAFHEEELIANSSNGSNSTMFGRENAYSMNYDSDDDLVDSAPSAGQQIRDSQSNIQNNRITIDLLQQAILAASSEASPSTSSEQSGRIFSFSNRPQPQSTSASASALASASTPTMETTNQVSQSRDWSVQLNTMRELGFTNDMISIQALEVTNGNVQEAIVILLDDV